MLEYSVLSSSFSMFPGDEYSKAYVRIVTEQSKLTDCRVCSIGNTDCILTRRNVSKYICNIYVCVRVCLGGVCLRDIMMKSILFHAYIRYIQTAYVVEICLQIDVQHCDYKENFKHFNNHCYLLDIFISQLKTDGQGKSYLLYYDLKNLNQLLCLSSFHISKTDTQNAQITHLVYQRNMIKTPEFLKTTLFYK